MCIAHQQQLKVNEVAPWLISRMQLRAAGKLTQPHAALGYHAQSNVHQHTPPPAQTKARHRHKPGLTTSANKLSALAPARYCCRSASRMGAAVAATWLAGAYAMLLQAATAMSTGSSTGAVPPRSSTATGGGCNAQGRAGEYALTLGLRGTQDRLRA